MLKLSSRRYTGSKAQLTQWIMEIVSKQCKGTSFADLFAGTGVVAEAASQIFNKVMVNDFLPSNRVIYEAFLGKGKFGKRKLDQLIADYNKMDSSLLEDNYFSINYGDKYFSRENARKIGHIRENIEMNKSNLTRREYHMLISSLLYSADKIANTVGHYDAFFKSQKNRGSLNLKPVLPVTNKQFDIYSEDSNKLARRIQYDVVYIDPPYNSRQYSRFYHVLDNLTTWQKPDLYGVARKPKPTHISEYSKVKAKYAFKDLIDNLKCRYIVVSYNNTYSPKSSSSKNKIALEEIEKILSSKGPTSYESRSHKHFNTGKTEFNDHKEYLFVTKVRQ